MARQPRRSRPQRDPQNLPLFAQPFAICAECGKVGYSSKTIAKQVARLRYPGSQMRAYKCAPWWHLTSQDTATVTFHRELRRGQS